MDQPRERETERLRDAVHSARASVEHTATELHERVHRATDLQEQVRAHPIVALSIAAIAGLVIGRQLVSLLGIGGIATLGATTVLRGAGPMRNGHPIADRIIDNAGAVLTSAVLMPIVSSLRKLIETATSRPAGSPGAEPHGGRAAELLTE